MSAHECLRFRNDPLKFARDVCINLQTADAFVREGDFDPNKSYSPCWFDLEPFSSSLFSGAVQVILKPTTQLAAGLLQGYYVPYISYGKVASTTLVLLDDVPTSSPAYTVVFTGGQNGCSLLMLKGRTADTLSFVHYPNSNGKKNSYPLLGTVGKTAADILLAIDYDMYGDEDKAAARYNPNAASFFFHNGKQWVGVTQPQVQALPPHDKSQKRASMSINRIRPPRFITASGGGIIP